MLNLLIGPAGSGKTEYLLDKLHNYYDTNIISNDILVILPSRAACDNFIQRFGDSPVLGLNIETFRSFSLKIIDNSNIDLKLLNYGFTYFLNIALDSLLKSIDIKSNVSSAISVLHNWNNTASKSTLYQTLASFMREGITGRKLRNIADNTSNLIVANTCYAHSMLIDKYNSLLKENGFYDESETEALSASILSKRNAIDLKYKVIIVDGFSRFVQSQIEIINQLCRISSETCVSFCFDESRKDNFIL